MLERLLELSKELQLEYAWARAENKVLEAAYLCLAINNLGVVIKWESQLREGGIVR